jgi:FkbM family methyltransferase
MFRKTLIKASRHLRFRGKNRIMDALGIGLANRENIPRDAKGLMCLGGLKMHTYNAHDLMFRELYLHGYYQDDVLVALLNLMQTGDVFWDVGANYGYMSVFVEKACSPSVTIHAFEPNPTVVQILKTNLSVNACLNTHVHEIGLSDHACEIPLFMAWDNSWNATIMPQYGEHMTDHSMAPTTITCQPIDELVHSIQPPNVIKIDVEGAEHLVLRGGMKYIRARRPILLLEFNRKILHLSNINPEELLKELADCGYRFLLLRRPWFGFHRWGNHTVLERADELPVFCNLVCITPEDLEKRQGRNERSLSELFTGGVEVVA